MSLSVALSALYVLFTACSGLAVVLCALTHRGAVRSSWRLGLLLSGVVALLLAPGWALSLRYFDPAALLVERDLSPGLAEQAADTVWWAMAGGIAASAILGLLYRVLLVPVAQLAQPDRPAFPVLTRREGGAVLPWAFGLGLFLGGLSALGAWAMGIGASELVSHQARLFPGVDLDAPPVVLGIGLPSLLAAAISEELLFRGVVQRWLSRWWGPVLSIGITSTIWALGHAANTDAMGLKLAQIGALGLVFGLLARRHGVEASVVAHLGLNTAVVLVSLVLQP